MYNWYVTDIWPIHDQDMTNTWPILDQFMTNTWPIHDQYMTAWPIRDQYTTNTWPVHDQYATNTWRIPDQCTSNTWPIHEQYTTNTWPVRDKYTTNTRPTYDQYMTNTWRIPDQCTSNTWPIHDQYTTNTWPIHDKCTINTRSIRDQHMIHTRPIHDPYMTKLASCMVYQVTYVQCCIVQSFTAGEYQNTRQLQQKGITVPRNYASVRHTSKREILLLLNTLKKYRGKRRAYFRWYLNFLEVKGTDSLNSTLRVLRNSRLNVSPSCLLQYTEWPKKMYTLFTQQYLWNKFKWNFYFRVRV